MADRTPVSIYNGVRYTRMWLASEQRGASRPGWNVARLLACRGWGLGGDAGAGLFVPPGFLSPEHT